VVLLASEIFIFCSRRVYDPQELRQEFFANHQDTWFFKVPSCPLWRKFLFAAAQLARVRFLPKFYGSWKLA